MVGSVQPLDHSLSLACPCIPTMNTGAVTRGSLSNLASRRASKRVPCGDLAPRAEGVEDEATDGRMDHILSGPDVEQSKFILVLATKYSLTSTFSAAIACIFRPGVKAMLLDDIVACSSGC